MEKFAAYDSLEVLHKGPLYTFARGKTENTAKAVLLKAATTGLLQDLSERWLAAEAEFLAGRSLPDGIPGLNKWQGGILELENAPGILLSDFLARQENGHCSLETGLEIAQNLSMLLFRLRQHRLEHLALCPPCILIDPESLNISITGFGIQNLKVDLTQLSEFLPYMSPEQTGRLDRKPDYRSDLYSLGAILFEVFTGQPPFQGEDKMGLIHSHLARMPAAPHTFVSGVPTGLSKIILRLLTKNPGDRFPSAASLLNELSQVKKEAGTDGKASTVSANQDRFRLQDKLYGRAAILEQLEKSLQQAKEGNTVLFFLSGSSGVGKSALAAKLGQEVTQMGGFYAAGKYDQYNRNTPFLALMNAFRHLLNKLLTLEDQELQSWKERLKEALGANAPVVASLLPEIELVIGKQEKLPVDDSSTELISRLNKVLKDFMRQFAAPQRPLLLFLDDLQWGDHSSFELLHGLLLDDAPSNIMLIGTFRDNAIAASHPLHDFRNDAREHPHTQEVALAPLSLEAIGEMLSDTLHTSGEDVLSLARIVHQKSAGNPFFAREFLRRLYRAQLIQYNYIDQRWTWDEVRIAQSAISGNAVQLMVEMIASLSDTEQRVLKLASFFAGRFQEATLLNLFGLEAKATHLALEAVAQRGLIIPTAPVAATTGGYRFAHDMVQQAAYEMVPEPERATVHFQIAQDMAQRLPTAIAQEKAFEIIFHYSHGVNMLQSEDEKFCFVELSLEAARKSKAGAAWQQVLTYLDRAIPQIASPATAKWYPLWFEVVLLRYEAQEHLNLSEAARASFALALEGAQSRPEKARLYLVKARIHIFRTELEAVLEACIAGLQLLDVNVPRKAGNLRVFLEFLRTQWYLRGKSQDILAALPERKDQGGKYIGELLYLSLHPTYVANPTLYATFCLKTLQVTLKSGVSSHAFLGFSTYGLFLAVGFNQFAKAYTIQETGVRLSTRIGESDSLLQTSRAFMKSYGGHMRDGFTSFEKAFAYSDERGMLREATEPLTLYGINQYHAGVPLDEVETNVRKYLTYARKAGTEHLYNSILVVYHNVLRMRGHTDVRLRDIRGQLVDGSRMRAILYDTDYLTIRAYFNLMQMQQAYLLGELDRAEQILRATLPIAHSVAGAFSSMEIVFYQGLIIAARAKNARGWARRQYCRKLRKLVGKMRKWAKAAPQNYAHRVCLLEAELAAAKGDEAKALQSFDAAISLATEHQFHQNAAIAQERAAQICLRNGLQDKASTYLEAAYTGFKQWGATLKVQHMHHRYQLELNRQGNLPKVKQRAVAPGIEDSPDVISLLKASHIISGEISLKGLLSHLIRILIENAGAERGVLLIENEGEFQIQASGSAASQEVEILQNSGSFPVPRSIVNYVSRSRKALVLDDATHDPEFGKDPYIREFRPQSILCHPIVNQSKLSGILYLENNLTTSGFTTERLAVLDILAAQAAISIENALLYDDLEERVDIRTRELKKTLEFLRTTQDQLVQSEKLASLGQVTAGIAHEIRNPLNFVNNFSELSMDLAAELQEVIEEMKGKNLDANARETIAEYLDDLQSNAEKIQRHGKRAESIVHNMLLHAASGSDEMQLVDFNKLTREYALLAYHGIRGRLTTFSCQLKYDFDPDVGELEIRQQDISRALLNIFQNAFQAMEEKSKSLGNAYRPELHIASRLLNDKVELRITDNGPGIPQDVRDHIFEPFFTTKPTGKGTGLGLSLAYDLIVQGHNGSLQVNSQAGESTEFVITLPRKNE